MKNFLVALPVLLTLVACSSVPAPIPVDVTPVERPKLIVPNVDKFTSKDVTWIVVTPDNVEQVFSDLEKSGNSIVLFALTDKGYENISLNMADIAKLVKQQQSIIAAYRQYYEKSQ